MPRDASALMDLFERNPYAAFLSLACLAIAALFTALMLSWRARAASSERLIPIAEGLKATIDRNNEVLEDTVEVLDRAVLVAELAAELRPRASRRAKPQIPQSPPVAAIGDPHAELKAAVAPVAVGSQEGNEEDPPAGE